MQQDFASAGYFAWMPAKQDSTRGDRLRDLRTAAGLSQSELAAILDVHRSNIGFWEKSGIIPRSELLPVMAKALGVSVNVLLGEGAIAKTRAQSFGRLRTLVEAVNKLPRRQQQQAADLLELFVEKHARTQRSAETSK